MTVLGAILVVLALPSTARTADGRSAAPVAQEAAEVGADTATKQPSTSALRRILDEADSLVRRQGGPRGDSAQLFLSWDAPWGEKRARRYRIPSCADSTREDTLYLSFLPGRRAQRFTGFTAQLYLNATGGDTLGTWWHMEGKGGKNGGSLRAEWAATPGFGWRQPFPLGGQGFTMLDRTPQAVRLRLVFAVPMDGAGPVVADSMYTLCRLIFTHRPSRRLAGCGQPVCVEWAAGTLAFGPKDEPQVRRGERFVSYGGPDPLCEPFRGPRPRAWKPGARPAHPPTTRDSTRTPQE